MNGRHRQIAGGGFLNVLAPPNHHRTPALDVVRSVVRASDFVFVDVGEGDAMEREVPGGEPRVLPRVRHGDHVGRVEVTPVGVSDVPDWILLLPPREDVSSYYRMADVFLSPSRQEGFCYALVEAAYCRTPVLASAIDAQKDLALPKSAFFPPEDVEALASVLLRVLSEEHTASRAQALEQAGERVRQTYALSRWAERVLAAYLEIL